MRPETTPMPRIMNMMFKKLLAGVMVGFVLHAPVIGQKKAHPVLEAISTELDRSFSILKEKGDPPPYFMSFRVTDLKSTLISSANGALQISRANHSRLLDSSIRVGSYEFDNTRLTQGLGGGFIELPIDNDVDAIRSEIWIKMDGFYRAAVEQLRQAKQRKATTVEDEFNAADFSKEDPMVASDELKSLSVDKKKWEQITKRVSSIFNKYPLIYTSTVSITADASNKFIVNTEGASLQFGTTQVRVAIYAVTKAKDGMNLFRFESFEAPTSAGIPDEAKITAAAQKVAKDLMALREAPTIEPYTGPAILSGRASGVFFHEIFGHRVEGHRQKSELEGNTFTAKVEQKVLPPFFSVTDDPTRKRFGKVDLSGHYVFDDEGIKAQPVPLVRGGVLKTFLMGRSPIESVARSNGHGRAQPGRGVVSRQGNLIISAEKTNTRAELRKMLLDEIKRQDKPFGLFFDDISGGFTNTSRFATQAFQVTPVMVYKVFADGRPDQLVRGLDLIGTPLTVFSKIIAADDSPQVFNGICGAESGWVPVSAISPGILVSQIEVQKRIKSKESPPVLPPPGVSIKEWKEVTGQ